MQTATTAPDWLARSKVPKEQRKQYDSLIKLMDNGEIFEAIASIESCDENLFRIRTDKNESLLDHCFTQKKGIRRGIQYPICAAALIERAPWLDKHRKKSPNVSASKTYLAQALEEKITDYFRDPFKWHDIGNQRACVQALRDHLYESDDCRIGALQLTKPSYTCFANHRLQFYRNRLNGVVDEMVNKCIMPAFMLELFGEPISKEKLDHADQLARHVNEPLRELLWQTIIDSLQQPQPRLKDFAPMIAGLARSWEHEANVFPDLAFEIPGYAPPGMAAQLRRGRSWLPLYEQPFTAPGGYTLHCLTNTQELKREHRAIRHCVDGFATFCCGDNEPSLRHLFSVRNPDGKRVSTVSMACMNATSDSEGRPSAIIPDSNQKLVVLQHERKKTLHQTHIISSGPEHDAVMAFLNAVRSGACTLNSELGETKQSRQPQSLGIITSHAGYYPTWRNVDMAFQEYKSPMRRAAEKVDENNQLVFAEPPVHLIDGTTKDGQSLRLMHVRDWLRATGLLEAMHELARTHCPVLALASEAVWKNQARAPIRTAHGYNNRTLDGNAIATLPSDQRRTYLGRVKEGRQRDHASFARSGGA